MLRCTLLFAMTLAAAPTWAEDLPPVGSPFTPGVQNNTAPSAPSSPYTPGVQNQSPAYNYSPFTPGNQNQGTGWDTGGSNWNTGGWNGTGGGSAWNSGGLNGQYAPGAAWQTYQPQQRYSYTAPQSQYPSYGTPSGSYSSGYHPSSGYPASTYPSSGYAPQPYSGSSTYPTTHGYTPQTNYSGAPIQISMPDDQSGTCGYTLASGTDAWNYTMVPGKSQQFSEDRSWQITFDRGNGYGQQSYRLIPGYYRFRQSSQGWELYHSKTPDPVGGNAPPPPQ